MKSPLAPTVSADDLRAADDAARGPVLRSRLDDLHIVIPVNCPPVTFSTWPCT